VPIVLVGKRAHFPRGTRNGFVANILACSVVDLPPWLLDDAENCEHPAARCPDESNAIAFDPARSVIAIVQTMNC